MADIIGNGGSLGRRGPSGATGMGDTGTGMPPWSEQTVGERIVAAAWRAVAAHLARLGEAEQEQQRVAAGGAGELDPLTDGPTGAEPPAGHGRLR